MAQVLLQGVSADSVSKAKLCKAAFVWGNTGTKPALSQGSRIHRILLPRAAVTLNERATGRWDAESTGVQRNWARKTNEAVQKQSRFQSHHYRTFPKEQKWCLTFNSISSSCPAHPALNFFPFSHFSLQNNQTNKPKRFERHSSCQELSPRRTSHLLFWV